LDQEQLASSIPSQSESGVSALVRPVSASKPDTMAFCFEC
jgi:hypothetical protein